MSLATTGYHHIQLDERGVPVIAGTRFKVTSLIEQMKAWAWSAEQAHENHPQLSHAQIYSALAYYQDRRQEIDREIERHRKEFDETRQRQQAAPDRRQRRSS